MGVKNITSTGVIIEANIIADFIDFSIQASIKDGKLFSF